MSHSISLSLSALPQPSSLFRRQTERGIRDWYFIAEKSAPAPHLAHLEGCAALRIVLVTVSRISRSCMHFPDGFDLHLLQGLVNNFVMLMDSGLVVSTVWEGHRESRRCSRDT